MIVLFKNHVLAPICPSSHQYAYLNGKYCCRTNKEKIGSGKDGDLCDGSEIGIDSRCCEDNAYVRCEYEKCSNHSDAITNTQGNLKKLTFIIFIVIFF